MPQPDRRSADESLRSRSGTNVQCAILSHGDRFVPDGQAAETRHRQVLCHSDELATHAETNALYIVPLPAIAQDGAEQGSTAPRRNYKEALCAASLYVAEQLLGLQDEIVERDHVAGCTGILADNCKRECMVAGSLDVKGANIEVSNRATTLVAVSILRRT